MIGDSSGRQKLSIQKALNSSMAACKCPVSESESSMENRQQSLLLASYDGRIDGRLWDLKYRVKEDEINV